MTGFHRLANGRADATCSRPGQHRNLMLTIAKGYSARTGSSGLHAHRVEGAAMRMWSTGGNGVSKL
jgi:hypothetical protein